VTQASNSFRLPAVSIRNQGMNEAMKNQVNSPPANNAALSLTREKKLPA
jgi:hypothetical protein